MAPYSINELLFIMKILFNSSWMKAIHLVFLVSNIDKHTIYFDRHKIIDILVRGKI